MPFEVQRLVLEHMFNREKLSFCSKSTKANVQLLSHNKMSLHKENNLFFQVIPSILGLFDAGNQQWNKSRGRHSLHLHSIPRIKFTNLLEETNIGAFWRLFFPSSSNYPTRLFEHRVKVLELDEKNNNEDED